MVDKSFPDDLNPEPDDAHLIEEDDFVQAIFIGPPRQPTADAYDLGQLFLCWASGTGYRDRNTGARALARALRGLAAAGLIERRTIRRVSGPTHHGFVLTEGGEKALRALSGDWISHSRAERNA
jgi:hypothetical protein